MTPSERNSSQVPTVFAIDDDPHFRESLRGSILSGGYRYEAFPDAKSFLATYRPEMPGCAIFEMRIPDINGIDLLTEFRKRSMTIPVIFMTGHGNVQTAVNSLKSGAFDFIEKPYDRDSLLERIEQAITQDMRSRREQDQHRETEQRIAQLTRGELEVMRRIVASEANKKMATDLNVTERAIEYRRAGLMKKLRADSIVDVIRIALTHDIAAASAQQSPATHHTHDAHFDRTTKPEPHLLKIHGTESQNA